MTTCPSCSAENIDGSDECSRCGNSLSPLHLPEPANPVERALLQDRLSALSPCTPVCVPPDCPVRDVIQLLLRQHIGSVVVSEGDLVVGIFSERDALMKLGTQAAALGDRPVSQFMTPAPRTMPADAKVAFAIKEMDLGGYRHLPVVDSDHRIRGVISVRDVLRYLTRVMAVSW